MYNFIFWFFYRFFEWRKGFQSSFLACAMVSLALVIHISLAYQVLSYFAGVKLPYLSGSYGQRRLILMPLVIILFFILYFIYFRRKAADILERYSGKSFSKPINIIFIALLLIFPIFIIVKLSTN